MGALGIRVERLSKQYRIGAMSSGRLTDAITAAFRRRRDARDERIWALSDVSFDVHKGEVVGIIGANGSGKSTLLKILSRITRPTSGRVEVYGRLASLLEVGTGFHAELTGRENVYLNGVTLGMSRREVRAKFDEIVDFAGVERFIDTPVKRYSSGMYVRLAFAVAAHLEPEILVVDEVLSVGDAAFQKKSLRRMEDVAGSGRTVLFVSHSMPSVMGLCSRGVWLKDGRVMSDGAADQVVRKYLSSVSEVMDASSLADRTDRSGDGRVRITGLRLRDASGHAIPAAITGDALELVLSYESAAGPVRHANFWISVRDAFGRLLVCFWSSLTGDTFEALPPSGDVLCRIPRFPLVPGEYVVDVGASVNRDKADEVLQAARLEVAPGDFFGTGREYNQVGDVLCEHGWDALGARDSARVESVKVERGVS